MSEELTAVFNAVGNLLGPLKIPIIAACSAAIGAVGSGYLKHRFDVRRDRKKNELEQENDKLHKELEVYKDASMHLQEGFDHFTDLLGNLRNHFRDDPRAPLSLSAKNGLNIQKTIHGLVPLLNAGEQNDLQSLMEKSVALSEFLSKFSQKVERRRRLTDPNDKAINHWKDQNDQFLCQFDTTLRDLHDEGTRFICHLMKKSLAVAHKCGDQEYILAFDYEAMIKNGQRQAEEQMDDLRAPDQRCSDQIVLPGDDMYQKTLNELRH